jgi:hypothetical protein
MSNDLTVVLQKAINSNDPNLIASMIENGIPEQAIMDTEISHCGTLEINQAKYIIALKLMSMTEYFSDEHIIHLKNYIKSILKFFDIGSKETNSNEEIDVRADSIIELLWPTKQSNELDYIYLQLIKKFLNLNLEDLLEIQPYLKNNINFFQMIGAITEIIHNYFLLLKEFYKTENIDRQLLFPSKIVWCFDNADNPIEKNINSYVQEHSELLTNDEFGVSIDLSIEKYHEFIKKTFDFDKIISIIKKKYYFDQIESIIKILNTKSKYSITKDQIISLIVYDFVANNSLINYLL